MKCQNKLINRNGVEFNCGDIQSNGERIYCYKCKLKKKEIEYDLGIKN